ncbi:MAG: MBL fold metallo-hydrolase, partial [Myxococcales bacterium]|nr:MBL fold metallo-hydrolase [Myxococcales bacterium]
SHLSVTRVINASVLLELGGRAVLTDPFFNPRWPVRVREPVGLRVSQLPRLAAVLGGHRALDHWQPSSLAAYPFKADTLVYVAARSMARSARAAGFSKVEVVEWGQTRRLAADLVLDVLPAQVTAGMRANSYLLTACGIRVFIGTEARDLGPLRELREARGPVDIAVLPIDGSCLAWHRLVMTPRAALDACRILGARALVPIHYALKGVPILLQTPGSLPELLALAQGVKDLAVVPLEPGRRWTWALRAARCAETAPPA